MASGPSVTLLRQLHRLFNGGTVAGLGEGQLLDRFVTQNDGAAFEALVARHGPMVLGVCRRLLHDPRDVEDAFQATFLILVKKAGSIRDRDALGPWLHGVARRVALRARATAARRGARERPGSGPEAQAEAEEAAVVESPQRDAERAEFRAVIDEELGRLPEKFRAPLVLCYLEGLTHDEAAERLRWPVGTVRSRMARARDRLRDRLARRGLALPAAVVASALAAEAGATPLPPALLESTLKAAIGLAAARGATAGIVSAAVAAHISGVLNSMSLLNVKTIAAGLLALALTGGAVVAALQIGDSARDKRAAAPTLTPVDAADLEIQALQAQLDTAKAKRQRLISASNPGIAPPGPAALPGTAPLPLPIDPTAPDAAPPPSVMTVPGSSTTPLAAPGSMPATSPPMAMMAGAGASPMVNPAWGQMITVMTPNRDRVAVYTEGGSMKLYRVPEGTAATPVVGDNVVALVVEGKAIAQVAAFGRTRGDWSILDLKHPAPGPIISPIVTRNLVILRAGRYLCTFSDASSAWAVTDLGELFQEEVQDHQNASARSKPNGVYGPIVGSEIAVFRAGRRAYAYSTTTGVWSAVDLGETLGQEPTLSGPFITASGSTGLYVYSARTGKWEGIDLSGDKDHKKPEK